MSRTLALVVVSMMAVSIYARAENKPAAQPADKNAAAAAKPKAQAAAPAAAPAQAAQPDKKAEKPAAARPRQAEPEDDGTVMIDSRPDIDEAGRAPSRAAAGEREEADVPGGMPISYGQCKGVLNDGGRNLLVFESPDDGTITFVQVTTGKNSVSWKVVGNIGRSSD